uniref:MFS domain-containing protein n=1 Tax=Enterobius vermicularis TaxID=51028 RepID=A0A0N4UUG2_ENTVE
MHFLLRLRTLGATALISQGYIIRNLVVVELYPAAVRNTGFSFAGLIGKLRSMVAPQIFLISEIAISRIWPALSHLLMIVMAFVGLFEFQFLIPETKHATITDHLPRKDIK